MTLVAELLADDLWEPEPSATVSEAVVTAASLLWRPDRHQASKR